MGIKLTAIIIAEYLLQTMNKILSNTVSRLTLYIDKITGYHQCEFQHNGSTTGQIFCSHHIMEKKWEYNGTVQKLFLDFMKACDSVM